MNVTDNEIGLEYGKCYRIQNVCGERLGYQQGASYQYGNPDHQVFQVCLTATGNCLREGKADQKVKSRNLFYLYDTRGSSWSKGPTNIGFYGVYLYPNIYPNRPDLMARFQAWKDCDEVDEGEPCPLAVNLKGAYNNWNGLANTPAYGYVMQVANAYETVHWVFKEVKNCKGGRHGGEDVTSVDAFADDKSGYDFL